MCVCVCVYLEGKKERGREGGEKSKKESSISMNSGLSKYTDFKLIHNSQKLNEVKRN